MSHGPLIPRESSELDAAIAAYFHAPEPPPAFCAARELREAARRAGPSGQPRGVWARQAEELEARERRELAARQAALVRDTELRELLDKSTGYARRQKNLTTLMHNVRKILPDHRVANCMRRMSRNRPGVLRLEAGPAEGVEVVAQVDRSPELGAEPHIHRAAYRGVAVCGRPWVCPVCAVKVTELRRQELQAGVSLWREGGGAALLATFTYSHGPGMSLRSGWRRLSRAQQRWARSAVVKRWRRAMRWGGRIKSAEVTYGLNGWHPHSHSLELVEGEVDRETVALWRDELAAEWVRCCAAVGLDASHAHGFDLKYTNADVDQYIAKWGLASELTQWHAKRNRPDPDAPGEAGLFGYSPFDLLRIHAGELEAHPQLELTRERAAALYREYAEAVHGRSQLHWTRGLKADLGIEEITDAWACDRDARNERAEVLGALTFGEMRLIIRRGAQLTFLALVQTGGFEFARQFLEHWRDQEREQRRDVERRSRAMQGIAYLWRNPP